jgi:hypothetical protein
VISFIFDAGSIILSEFISARICPSESMTQMPVYACENVASFAISFRMSCIPDVSWTVLLSCPDREVQSSRENMMNIFFMSVNYIAKIIIPQV